MKAHLKIQHIGGMNPFKVQIDFCIPLFEAQNRLKSFGEMVILVRGLFLSS
jgi:hypothetical protein